MLFLCGDNKSAENTDLLTFLLSTPSGNWTFIPPLCSLVESRTLSAPWVILVNTFPRMTLLVACVTCSSIVRLWVWVMPRRHHESQTAVLVQTTVHLNRVNMVASAWINGLITSVNVLLGIWAEIARKVLKHAAFHILTFTGTITAWHI